MADTSDMRQYQTFYGIKTEDWGVNFATFSNHQYILVDEYISSACSCPDYSTASATYKFLYPQHIKKQYYIEGVISGHVTFGASQATSFLCQYRVTLGKVNENTNAEQELYTTGWKSVARELKWNATYTVGDEIVLPFWIDAYEKEELGEFDRLYIQVESTCSDNLSCATSAASTCTALVLWHGNNPTFEDLKIIIPFIF